jgi:hypothetical protein
VEGLSCFIDGHHDDTPSSWRGRICPRESKEIVPIVVLEMVNRKISPC